MLARSAYTFEPTPSGQHCLSVLSLGALFRRPDRLREAARDHGVQVVSAGEMTQLIGPGEKIVTLVKQERRR